MSGARPGSRALFPDLEPVAYLSHAAISPPSEPVRAAVASAVEEYARRGAAAVPAALERRARLRGKLAWLVGAQPAELALLPNTTSGIVAVAQCFPWRPGDRVLLFQGEFPANVTPWQRAAEAFGLEAALLPLDSDRSARRIRDIVRARLGVTVGVVVSDTFGRPWRHGLTDVAIGVAGIAGVVDLRGSEDALGRTMQVTEVAVADEIAAAAELVMGKSSGIPVAVVRGVDERWLRESSL